MFRQVQNFANIDKARQNEFRYGKRLPKIQAENDFTKGGAQGFAEKRFTR